MNQRSLFFFASFLLVFSYHFSFTQNPSNSIAGEVLKRKAALAEQPERRLLEQQDLSAPWLSTIQKRVAEATFFTLKTIEIKQLLQERAQQLKFRLQTPDGQSLLLELYQAEYLAPGFKLRKASEPDRPIPYDPGLHYRGIVNGEVQSLAMLIIHHNEMAGVIEFRGRQYNIGKVEGRGPYHMLYPADAMSNPPLKACYVDDLPKIQMDKKAAESLGSPNSGNCVKVYVEADYDIFVDKGGVTPTANYVASLFSQVIALFADESINLAVSEIFVWDIEDPYVGGDGETIDFLTQFRQHLVGDFNGADIAHLLGYEGEGGLAYPDVLCSQTYKEYGVGYSDVQVSFDPIPSYVWSLHVITHEIGHNLGSLHTHDCVWNGNNTPIDNCGPLAGRPSPDPNCFDNGVTPVAGTIMSYCHEIDGVGVSFVENFGPQPGNLIRDKVYNASCLDPCLPAPDHSVDAGISAIVQPNGCSFFRPEVTLNNYGSTPLTNVTIQYGIGQPNTYNWTGYVPGQSQTIVTLPGLLSAQVQILQASTSNPNGQQDEDASNDAADIFFVSNETIPITLRISLDDHPLETSWEIRNSSNTVVASGGGYTGINTTTIEEICLPVGCYNLTIFDSFGDGIGVCCSNDHRYQLTDEFSGDILANGGGFGFQETTNFCLTPIGGANCFQSAASIDGDPILSGTYSAAETITSSGVVDVFFPVTFEAGQSITLQPGFHAELGSSFIARIQDCNLVSSLQADSSGQKEARNSTPDFDAAPPLPNTSLSIAPNPFRNETLIRYSLPEERVTQLLLFDMLGRSWTLQSPSIRPAGYQEYLLSSDGLSNGIYFLRLQAGDEVITNKVQVLKN